MLRSVIMEYENKNFLPEPNKNTFSITCGKCKTKFEKVTSYYCIHSDCPTFTKAVFKYAK